MAAFQLLRLLQVFYPLSLQGSGNMISELLLHYRYGFSGRVQALSGVMIQRF